MTINVRVVGTANVTQMGAAFGKLEAQVTALNAQLTRMVALQNGVDPGGYERMAKAASMNSKVFRSAAASTGMFEVQQLRLNKATDDYVTKLQKQKISMRESVRGMLQQDSMYKKAYADQLRLSQMVARTSRSGIQHGKTMVDTAVPTVISKDLDTAGRRLAFFNEHLKSGATQMINWGKNTQWAGRQLTVGLSVPIAALGAAAGVMAYQVDQALTRVQKVYNTTAQQGIAQQRELDQVRKAGMATAIEAAKQYGSAGTDTLNVQAELAAAGRKGAELQKDTIEVMRISRLGELDYNDSIAATISLQSVFNMNSKKLGETFNYINDVENQTSLQTQDFAKAIPIAAAPVKAFGGDIQELGTLLVAMKQNGIQATQGANAIKAAMQRLGRPSKQVQEEWTALTNTDITKIFKNSTSLIDLFTKIGDATKNLAPKDQIKAFAGLFGTYQVTRMMAMVHGMEDLKNGVGQVSVAAKLAGQSTAQWSKVANAEIDRYQNSISGKWDRAIQAMKLQLSTLGKPFVEVATGIISMIAKIIQKFNSIPDVGKKFIAIPILIAALVGPALMMIGLFGNLIGNGIKYGSVLISLGAKMDIATTSQRAAALVAEQNTNAMTKELTAAEMLTMQIDKLTLAQQTANRWQRRAQIMSLVNSGVPAREAVRQVGVVSPLNSTNKASSGLAAQSAATSRNWKGIAASTTIASASMGAMMISSNKTVDHVAQIGLIASLFGPQFVKAGGALTTGFKAARVEAAAAGGGVRGMVVGANAFRVAMAASLGPITLAVAAVTAIGIGIYAWKKHEDAITQAKREQNLAMYKQNSLLDDALKTEQKRMLVLTPATQTTMPTATRSGPDFNAAVSAFQKTGEGQKIVSSYQDAANAADQATIAANVYYHTLTAKGGNARKAIMALSAMFVAAGDDIGTADLKARQLASTLKDVRGVAGQTKLFSADFTRAATTGDQTSAGQQGTELGKQLMNAMARATTQDAPHLFDGIQQQVDNSWKNALANISPLAQQQFKNAGIQSKKQFDQLLKDWSPGGMDPMDLQKKYGNLSDAVMQLKTAMSDNSGLQAEKSMVKYFVDQLHLSKDIVTLTQLRKNETFKLLFVNKENEESLKRQMVASRKSAILNNVLLGGLAKGVGLKTVFGGINKEVDGIIMRSEKANGTWVDGASKAKHMVDIVKSVPPVVSVRFSISQMVDVYKAGMTNVQQSIADDMSSSFDTNMQNALDARQKMWDNREAAQSRRFNAQSQALDNKWSNKKDAAEKMWDARIKKIQEASKAEQKASDLRDKMFDDEMARLQKLADMANTNIDFNSALNQGNFDEAAKIRNDATAKSEQDALEKAKAKADAQSQRRIERLAKIEDRLNTRKDTYMKALDKREQAEKNHMDKMHSIQEAGLKNMADADNKAYQAEWDARKATLDSQLQLFMDFIAGNQQQLKQHMKDVGLSYDQFQKNVIEPKGKTWGEYFGEKLHYGIRDAGLKLMSDSMWNKMGSSGIKGILAGMGFPSMGGFKKFLATGNLPANFGKTPTAAHGKTTSHPHHGGTQDGGGYHTGGRFGIDPGGRQGRRGGLRGDEGYALLQHGEMVMNKAATQKYYHQLKSMNSEGIGVGGESGPTASGIMMGISGKMFMAGVSNALKTIVGDQKKTGGTAGGPTSAGFISGPGGRHRPVPAGIGYGSVHDISTGYPAIDIKAPLNTPAYAVGNGTITRSEAITHGGTPGNGLYSIPYSSYGNVEYLKLDGGPTVLYAHLNKRMAHAGQRVKGGSRIGLTGNTGNSTGPHLHFGDNDGNPAEFMRSGGHLRWDNTPAVLHRGETVLTQPLTKEFKDNVANKGGNTYNVEVNVEGSNSSADEIAEKVIRVIRRAESRQPKKGRRG